MTRLIAECAILLGCLLSSVAPSLYLRHLRGLRQLADVRPPDPAVWPSLSVIIPARNEADRIETALRSRLADDYPGVEFLLVDDRSDDGTGDIATRLAQTDSRLRVLRIDELPEGWLGKVHALSEATKGSTAEWLLFSDADVHVEPGVLRRAVALAVADELDCIALIPGFGTGGSFFEAVWSRFLVVLGAVIAPSAVRDPKSRTALGSGAFTLIRRAAYDRTPGFEHLRLETGDDVALGAMIKQHGGRCDALGSRAMVSVAIYHSVGEFITGVEKNGSTTLGPPFAALVAGFVLLIAADYSAFLGLIVGPVWLRIVGLAVIALQTIAHCMALRTTSGTWLPGLMWPAGTPVMAYGMLRSAWLVRKRKGVLWRGTFYPSDKLLESRRFTFGREDEANRSQ